MPLKRKFGGNEGKRLHRDSPKPEFAGMPDYESGSPPALPKVPDISPNQAGCKPQQKPTIYPSFKPQIQKYISFCPVEVSQIPEETPDHPKEFLIFATF